MDGLNHLMLVTFSVAASVVAARQELRNRLNHGTADDFKDEKVFRPFWSKVENSLNTFKYTKINEFQNLESGDVDLTIFAFQIDKFMNDVGTADRKEIILEVLNWLQNDNKKSKIFQVI